MEKLNFTVEVNAPVHTVWTTMLDDATYRQWTSPFNAAGSWYEGSWVLGSEIRFIGPDTDGSLGGMIATVIENKSDERVTLEYLGEILRGVEYRDERSKFFGGRETYSYSESGGVTTVRVDLDSEEDFSAMFREMWPLALDRLKAIAES
ncbi:Uncharacterized conserved protein YndB, AHSA1/START domain [Cryobacterium psychrotolerans]|uniref:Uncharacterized conserved protein YndB, AHSA1/START domain n=1 Tax=Cryobacterium psychrotolerans TaxID=386301 RepID=A0A1G9E504_9MICO|nr:SRPBCC family protein [Cryobacterium psychrotolerans]TFD86422.1 hypothetical protein E3T56_07510 [Cryobacterium psychrotolerans]SDK71194.1 Uncharacterized conserved protein YndB, AHSA1/START domain [Cryobacterium psychrotolerans]